MGEKISIIEELLPKLFEYVNEKLGFHYSKLNGYSSTLKTDLQAILYITPWNFNYRVSTGVNIKAGTKVTLLTKQKFNEKGYNNNVTFAIENLEINNTGTSNHFEASLENLVEALGR